MDKDSSKREIGEKEEWIRNTDLFRQSRVVHDAIDRHKWIESEKAGHDIGWDRAAIDWLMHSSPQHLRSGGGTPA